MKFDEIEWHDQIFSGININRTNPGNNDSIELRVVIDGNEMVVLFDDVYFADIKMNFGIVADESIRYAIINTDDIEIINIQKNGVVPEVNWTNFFALNLTLILQIVS
jgi:hypothetical protein